MAGITWHGKTPIVIFDGKMNAASFIEVMTAGLIPYLQQNSNPTFMQDNDPKHTSTRARFWLEKKNVNWWKTPPESPDLNPIEYLRHELKEYNRRVVKPKNKQQLASGIMEFWGTVTV